jgi:glutaredoxin
VIATSAPASASFKAEARPKRFAAPVMSTTFPKRGLFCPGIRICILSCATPGSRKAHFGATFQWKLSAGFARLPPMSFLREVIVYSRKGCHLCEIVKEKLTKLERRGGFRWHEVDVETNDLLRRQFTDEVPVIFIDGRKAFKYRLDEQEFLKKLAS